MAVTRRYTYRDLDFNFIQHPVTGDVSTKVDAADVQQSIRNLVLTSFYERGFATSIGTSIPRLLFENISPTLSVQVEDEVKVLIANFEPRADLVSVDVGFDDNYMGVAIKFNILNNDTVREVYIKLKRP